MSNFILKFLAHIFQDPSKKVGVCVVLSSDQGAGKGLLEDFLALLIGKAYQVTVTDDASLTGNFNCHLSNKLLIVANELGHMGAAHTCANKLKSLITDATELMTPKGVDTIIGRSVASVLMFTNSKMVVKVAKDCRRYALVECNNDLANNPEYMVKLCEAIHDEETQVEFFRQMRELDISNFHFGSNIPATNLRETLQQVSHSATEQWLQNVAEVGIDGDKYNDLEHPLYLSAIEILTRTRAFMKTTNIQGELYLTTIMQGMEMKQLGFVKERRQTNGTRETRYQMPKDSNDLVQILNGRVKTRLTESEVVDYISKRPLEATVDSEATVASGSKRPLEEPTVSEAAGKHAKLSDAPKWTELLAARKRRKITP
jgi:hypothetical protein